MISGSPNSIRRVVKTCAATASLRRRGTRPWRLWVCLFVGCCVFPPVRTAVAQQSYDEGVVNREYPLKALFLYNFGGYVEWPADAFGGPQDPFVIGVLGSSQIDHTLQEIAATKKINGRKIVVQHYASADALLPCQILFVSRDVPPQTQADVFSRLQHERVLIVGESTGFAARGCVNFFVEANKIRFEINIEQARRHQLKISAKLLALAKIVPNN